MLSTGPAKTAQTILGHIVATLYRHLFDGIRHILDRDRQESGRDLLFALQSTGCLLYLYCHAGKTLPDDRHIQSLLRVRTKHPREVIRLNLAQHDVTVGYRQRTVIAVAGRPGASTGRLRSHPITRTIELQYRTATGRYRMDAHHRRTHTHSSDLGFKGALKLARIMTDIGRGASHIEANQPV